MKMNRIGTVVGMAVALTALQVAVCANADQEAKAKNFDGKGTISAINTADRTVTVRNFLRHRTFNLSADCAITVGNKKDATLADLKPRMEVTVGYKNVDGALVANWIKERQEIFTGSIRAIDPKDQSLVLEKRGLNSHFRLGTDCQYFGNNNQPGTLNDLKIGQRVTVHYVRANQGRIAERIEQPAATLVSTLAAIDSLTGTVKTKQMLSEKNFVLADGCKIVIGGKPNGRLSDLRLGEKVAIDYRDADGVLVATRIAPVEAESSATTKPMARAAK